MSLVHNVITRGLNAIYLQAPHVLPADTPDFLGYATAWSDFVHIHHAGEEAAFFPTIEQLTGVPGIMDGNIQQHEAFSAGLKAFDEYIAAATRAPESFSGARLVEIIDGFGQALVQHLADEIPTILALAEHREKMDISKVIEDEAKHSMSKLGFKTTVPYLITALDVTFEEGLHRDFPPAPGLVKAVARALAPRFNKGYWRFAPCAKDGLPKDMLAAPEK
jgi:hemerythrin-like domain-containing protein